MLTLACPRRRLRAFVAILVASGLLFATGCARSTYATAGGPRAPSMGSGGACWPVVPMRLLALEHGREWEPVSELHSDGMMFFVAKSGRPPLGRVVGDSLVDASGRPQIACAAGGRLMFQGRVVAAGYGPNDELVFQDDGTRIFVGDDGTVFMESRGKPILGPPGSGRGVVRIEGARGPARRTGALLVLLSLGGPPR